MLLKVFDDVKYPDGKLDENPEGGGEVEGPAF